MALILIMNLINTSLTHNIKSVIHDQPTADDVKQILTDASDSVKTIFGKTIDNENMDDFDPVYDEPTNSAENSDSPEPQADETAVDDSLPAMAPSSQAPVDFRIDEDILTQILADSDRQ